MLDDQDEKYEGHDEGEYHFSDEEVSYEVESDVQQKEPVSYSTKSNMFSNLSRSKRMLISLGVFFSLVLVVYKVVAPSSPTLAQATDIMPVPAVATKQAVAPAPLVPTTPPAQQVAAQMPPPAPSQAPVASSPITMQPTVSILPTTATTAQPAQVATQQPVVVATPASNEPAPAAEGMASQQPVSPTMQPPTVPQGASAAPAGTTIASTLPPGLQPETISQPAEQMAQVSAPGSGMIDNKMYEMAVSSQKLIADMQSDYAKKLDDYAARNKALEDQLQTLNSRVVTMETQLSQLVQALTRQSQGQNPSPNPGDAGSSNDVNAVPAQVQPAMSVSESRSNYNVQAIIPGRAWLKSTSGETLTVAEGDIIKDFGRVTKIDPYNGVIEVNTGTHLVSLSYGSMG